MFRNILLLILFFSFLVSCSEKSNPVEPNASIYSPSDPNAPKINNEWANWIKENAKCINPPHSTDFSDLEFLRELLNGKEIVQLGESSHGVKEFNLSKVRFIKYLHEELNYNVIAFESSLFDCYYADKHYSKYTPVSLMQNAIYGVWETQEVQELFSYIIETKHTNNPLTLTGFDMKPSYGGRDHRPTFLKNIFTHISEKIGQEIFEVDKEFTNIAVGTDEGNAIFREKYQEFISYYENFYNLLLENWDKLINHTGSIQNDLHIAKLTLESVLEEVQFTKAYLSNIVTTGTKIRDTKMANNLVYLKNHVYKNEKIIVWAHNFHIRYNNFLVEDKNSYPMNTMGYYLSENLRDQIYSIGFYTYSGQVANNDRTIREVTPMISQNVEAIIYSAGYYFTFIDLFYQTENSGNSWMFKNVNAKYWGGYNLVMRPREQYDAIYTIYKTSPPDYVEYY